jgi:putative FmdB family regulatory protein
MPTYQYQCRQCGFETEELQSMSEAPLLLCPRCNTENLMRILGGGAGLIFKGTGFYLTDYKKGTTGGSGTPKKPERKSEEQQGEGKKSEEKRSDEKRSDEKQSAGKRPDEKKSEEKKPEKKEPPKDIGGPAKS